MTMLKRTKMLIILPAALALFVTASGCTKEKNKAKEELIQALAKQTEMKAYSFSGSADLNIRLPAAQGSNPLTQTLIGLFTQSRLEWSGAATYEPVRLEANVKSTPTGSTTPIELPIMIKDNKLYLHIPLLSKQDEYYAIDMAELAAKNGQAQANPLSLTNMNQLNQTVADALKLILADMDESWFNKPSETTLTDGTKAKFYKLEITEKNRKQIEEAIKAKLPQMIDLLANTGLLSQDQAASWKKNDAGFNLSSPGYFSANVDQTGFIREQSVNLTYSTSGSDGQAHSQAVNLQQSYNDINGAPKFTRETPQNPRNLADILKLIMPQTTKK